MTFETLKRSHLKRNIIIAVAIVLILTAIILTFTRAKYRTTQSMPLLQGTINFSPSDLNIVAMYLNQGGALPEGQTDVAPKFGYTLNTEQSMCEVNDEKDNDVEIVYEEGYLYFNKLRYKGTKCSAYFDLIPDNEKPVINYTSITTNDNSITVTVDASDNIGIYYYYFKLDNGEEIRSEEATYIFDDLIKDSIHTVIVRVEDAAGNEVSASDEVTVGLYAKGYILANEGGAATIEEKGTPDFSHLATTDEGMYAAEDDYGTSYYYRGAVNDNWVKFGTNASGQELYWRIIRINGDGTLRLIYNGASTATTGTSTQIQTSAFNRSYNNNVYVGYMYESGQVHGLTNNSTIKGILDTWYQNNLIDEAEYIEGSTGFCGDRTPYSGTGTGTSTTYYAAYNRLQTNKTPTLECSYEDGSGIKQDLYTTSGSGQGNQALTYPIGLITADEVVMAGGLFYQINGSANNTNYYLYTDQDYWTMSPSSYDDSWARVFFVNDNGDFNTVNVNATPGVRPVINLKANIALSGSGSATDPYTINS